MVEYLYFHYLTYVFLQFVTHRPANLTLRDTSDQNQGFSNFPIKPGKNCKILNKIKVLLFKNKNNIITLNIGYTDRLYIQFFKISELAFRYQLWDLD